MSNPTPILAYSPSSIPSRGWSGAAIFDWIVTSLIGVAFAAYLAAKAGFNVDDMAIFAGLIAVPSGWLIIIIRLSIFRFRGKTLILSGIMVFLSALLALAVISDLPRC